MQTKRIKRPNSLQHGHIFNLKGLKFGDSNKSFTFQDFYPHVNLTGVENCIVISQTCDLENKKLPYITVGLLEKFERAPGTFLSDKLIESCFVTINDRTFYNDDILADNISDKIDSIIQNKTEGNSFLLFLSIKGENKEQKLSDYYFVNLTKLFPLRIKNYDNILQKTSHSVVDGFQYLIGWKMAALYGRVPVENYTKLEAENIAKHLIPSIQKGIQNRFPGRNFSKSNDKSLFKELKNTKNSLEGASNDAQKEKLNG